MRGMRRSLLIAVLGALLWSGSAEAQDNECRDFPRGATLLVGDSHTFIPGCDSYPGWDVDAHAGRNSTEGLGTVRANLASRHSTVVFDLATNDVADPATFRSNLRELWGVIGQRDLVLVTSYIPGGVAKPVNDHIRDFALAHPQRVEVVDWAAWARGREGIFTDGLHFTDAAYERRVAMVRASVGAQLRNGRQR